MERGEYKAVERGVLTSKGQITIPKSIRNKLNLSKGDRFEFKVQGDEIVLKKVSLIDEMEDLIIADLKKAGYAGKELEGKLVNQISIDPTICHGTPCIARTRIPVYLILELLGAGQTVEEVIASYPDLTPDDVKAAISYAAQIVGAEDVFPLRATSEEF